MLSLFGYLLTSIALVGYCVFLWHWFGQPIRQYLEDYVSIQQEKDEWLAEWRQKWNLNG